MNQKELYENYVTERCKTCKNKKMNLCNITITQNNEEVKARCSYYEEKKQ